MRNATTPRDTLTSVSHALRILSLLTSQSSLRVVDAAQSLGIAASTTHRLLACLKEHGYMQQGPGTRRYSVGPELLRLARHLSHHNTLERTARPHLESLCQEVNETVNLQILVNNEVLCLDTVSEDRHDLHVKQIKGRRIPAHASAAGKVLLAGLSAEERLAVYTEYGLPPLTSRTVTDPEAFEVELARVRDRGFAMVAGEREEGIAAIAVAVLDLDDRPIAAVSIAAPSARLPTARIPGLVRHLRYVRASITADHFALGTRGTENPPRP